MTQEWRVAWSEYGWLGEVGTLGGARGGILIEFYRDLASAVEAKQWPVAGSGQEKRKRASPDGKRK